jgi:RNA polymerase-binding transcription factor DksA
MNEEKELTRIRNELQAELDSLREQQAAVESQLDDRPQFGLGQGDPAAATWEMTLARRQRLETHIGELQDALERIDKGTYGRCQRCGREIDPERLEIVPTTSLCAECAGAEAQAAA